MPLDDPAVQGAVESRDPIVVVTAHRRENWNGGLARVAEAIGRLATEWPDTRFVVSLHPNPLVRRELGEPLAGYPNVICSEPLAYGQFARLLARASLVITDSGGIQEEAPSFGVPVLVARDSTEREEGIESGALFLVGTDVERIVAEAGRILKDPRAYAVDPTANPYGDGRASERVVAALEYLGGRGPAPERFGPGFSRTAVLRAAGYTGGLSSEPEQVRDAQPNRDEEHDRWVGR